MIPPRVYELCRSGKSVSGELARNPSEAPGKASKRLFGVDKEEEIRGEPLKVPHGGAEDLQRTLECGNWGEARPSETFLKVISLLLQHSLKC